MFYRNVKKWMAGTLCVAMVCGLAACGQQGNGANAQNIHGIQATGNTQGVEVTDDGSEPSKVVVVDEQESRRQLQDFSYKLLEQNLALENPVLSPVSAYFAMGLAGLGARGETKSEFDKVLGADLESYPQKLMNVLECDTKNMQVDLANSAWVDEAFTPSKDWMKATEVFYKAEAFKEKLSTEQTLKKINNWVEDETEGLIPGFLGEPLGTDVRLALLNTVYFDGKWDLPFDAESTYQEEFTTKDNQKVMVDMMQMYLEYQQYLKNDIAEGVVLPYEDQKYSFVALKPTDGNTVREMYEQLSMEEIFTLLDNKQEKMVNLWLPKFEITFDQILNNSLTNMGLTKAFSAEEADFSGIGATDSGNSLYISLVRQKAVVKVDEEGTEAAAVTVVMMKDGCAIMEDKPIDLFFDEPFFYMIVENETKTPLFMGILDKPVSGDM
ncbi:MAG: hypothetical protein IJF07_01805 [Lachnospiraceae bacterium]|nr:hypothetical protein [Lachnospiraceae bacterium]